MTTPEGQTRRQRLVELLSEGPTTVRRLAEELEAPMRLIAEDLAHVRRSLGGKTLVVKPSRCLDCNFELKGREKLTAPSRCPRCKSEHTSEPELQIQ
ncbi:MAG: transcriptional regulator [Deltaproteobacteria bacterium]|nr:transcriptional regulator [Deltaproteobacteria bacterium]